LTKSAAEIFNNKVSLIYEFNKKSPLFIRKADEEIKNNRLEKAADILNAGIKIYPEYAAAYFLLGRVTALQGNFNQALNYIKNGAALINSPKTYDYYLQEIDSIRKQRSLFDSTSRTPFFTPDAEQNVKLEPPPQNKKEDVISDSKNEKSYLNIDDRLDEIARDISAARINDNLSNLSFEMSGFDELVRQNMFVSETLAKIYVAQGEFKEAIAVYQKLILKNPAKQEYYLQKITELQSQLE
jgi:tetratricopeptide (TPR) repeat protein